MKKTLVGIMIVIGIALMGIGLGMENPQPITPLEVNGDDDPLFAMVMAAAMQEGKPVIGNLDKGKMTIEDVE